MHNQDPEIFGKVAVLMGGCSAERDISLLSGQAVMNALLAQGVDALAVDVREDVLPQVQSQTCDRVFNMIHGRGGEDGILQGMLESMDIPYTGSGVLGSALSMDKHRSKLCWQASGLPTPGWCVLNNESDIERCAEELGFPVMVKPSLEGSSLGMNQAADVPQLFTAWREASQYRCAVLAESWIEGREYTIGFLRDEALPPIRLETPRTFYDYHAKYCTDDTLYHHPCGLSMQQERSLQTLALRASRILGVDDWGRVDLLVDDSNQPWLIEVNTVPGMTDHSLVPMAAKAAGISFEQLVWRILQSTLEEHSESVL